MINFGSKEGQWHFESDRTSNKDKFKTSGGDAAKMNTGSIWNTQYMGPRTYESNLLLAHLDTGVWPH